MTLKEMIYHRKSCRSFTGKPVDAEMIEKILSFDLKPLYPEIKVRMDIVSRDQVKCICPWTTPQLITVYSEETDGCLAPSAVNSQPWYFTHAGDTIQVWCSKKGNRLDAGIALAHLYLANEENFRFFKADRITDLPGYCYIGSVTL